mmetsp:Transcript_512/g.971  ORF Transcript_512/g.971 Transcript_512/m.971 type:complete len:80 (+) Transcript_512:72-311(+)
MYLPFLSHGASFLVHSCTVAPSLSAFQLKRCDGEKKIIFLVKHVRNVSYLSGESDHDADLTFSFQTSSTLAPSLSFTQR